MKTCSQTSPPPPPRMLMKIRPENQTTEPQRGGKRKESLQLRLWNLNVCIKKVDVEC